MGSIAQTTDESDQELPRVLLPAFGEPIPASSLRASVTQAITAWLLRTPSLATRANYRCDLHQFLQFSGIDPARPEQLLSIRPEQVAAWREQLQQANRANSTVARKLTVLRSLFSYLQVYGYSGANPAHSKFVVAPAVPRDGKTVGLSPKDCRRLLEAPEATTPLGLRDRAIFCVLAFSACRVGELVRLKVEDFRTNGEHRVLTLMGKGGKERTVPIHLEAVEQLTEWLKIAAIHEDRSGPLFRPCQSARGDGHDGFARRFLTVRAIEYLVTRYAQQIGLDRSVTVHSFRVTALTTARERGADIADLQDFAGHADPRTTLTYIRTRDRLSRSPAYVLNY